jgi:glycerol-3-phosphate acyltransferase PlsY
MDSSIALWVAGGYLAGTLPSTWLVSRALGAHGLIRASRRDAGEDDAHVVVARRLGGGWGALAAILDVSKGIVFTLAARRWGQLPDAWLAMAGAAVVVGHAFPFYARSMAGRGLAAAAGVFLVLVPFEMVAAGLTMCVGFLVRQSGLFSTVGFGSVFLVASVRGQPEAFVAMALAIFVLVVIRRLEGVGEVVRTTGLSRTRAAYYRAVFDSSGPPGTATESEEASS